MPQPPTQVMSCAACQYSERRATDPNNLLAPTLFICRRFPKQLSQQLVAQQTPAGVQQTTIPMMGWPIVETADWCYEFKPIAVAN